MCRQACEPVIGGTGYQGEQCMVVEWRLKNGLVMVRAFSPGGLLGGSGDGREKVCSAR